MIAEQKKDFKTITLRGLDQRADLVEILNDVMIERGIKTGQTAIEYIIKRYATLDIENRKLSKQNYKQEMENWEKRRIQEVENEKLTDAVRAIQNAFKLINELSLNGEY